MEPLLLAMTLLSAPPSVPPPRANAAGEIAAAKQRIESQGLLLHRTESMGCRAQPKRLTLLGRGRLGTWTLVATSTPTGGLGCITGSRALANPITTAGLAIEWSPLGWRRLAPFAGVSPTVAMLVEENLYGVLIQGGLRIKLGKWPTPRPRLTSPNAKLSARHRVRGE